MHQHRSLFPLGENVTRWLTDRRLWKTESSILSPQSRKFPKQGPFYQYHKLLFSLKLTIKIKTGSDHNDGQRSQNVHTSTFVSSKTSSISDWYKHINKIAEIEEIIAVSKDSPSKFTSTWACWLHFRSSAEYSQALGIPTWDSIQPCTLNEIRYFSDPQKTLII